MKIWPFAAIAAASLALSVGGALANPMPQWAPIEDGVPPAQLSFGVYTPGDQPLFEQAQLFLWGGRNYCWYDFGWHGPGYYWCGYARRRGYGWGGPVGWHGWGHGRGYRGGYGYSHGGYRGGGYHHAGGHYGGGGRGHAGGGFRGGAGHGGGGHRGGGHGHH